MDRLGNASRCLVASIAANCRDVTRSPIVDVRTIRCCRQRTRIPSLVSVGRVARPHVVCANDVFAFIRVHSRFTRVPLACQCSSRTALAVSV